MPENEFEKQIQGRLDSLNLEPSAAVWQQVEYRIRKDKRRRWFILLPILAAGLGTGIWLASDSGKGSLANKAVVRPKAEVTAPSSPEKQTNQAKNVDGADTEESQLSQQSSINEKVEPVQNSNKKGAENLAGNQKDIQGKSRNKQALQRQGIAENNGANSANQSTGKKNQNISTEESSIGSSGNAEQEAGSQAMAAVPVTDSASLKKPSNDSVLIVKADEKKAATAVKKKAGRTWSFGLQGGMGVSAQSEALLGASQAAASDLYVGVVNPVGGNPISIGAHQTTKLKSAFAFSFGGYAEKRLSKALSFELGLVYSQYGSDIQTGNQVNNTTFISLSTSRFMSVSNYYQAQASQGSGSSTYHNRYHFLELPVKLNIRLNPSGKTAFRWELGVVPAYLVATNALHYDEQQNIFYHDNSYFSKFQFGFSTALSVRLFGKSKHSLWVGPEYRSFMTNLTNQKNTNSNHLYYGGLKASYRLH